MKIGIGYDVHAFEKGRKLIIGGVEIAHNKGLAGHSDADVLIHSIMDAIIGALGLGDIGKHFPDTDLKYKGVSSLKLLEFVYELMNARNFEIGNIDSVIVAQKPKMLPYIQDMKKNLSNVLNTDELNINIKATTTEKLGFEGREEGISSQAVVILKSK